MSSSSAPSNSFSRHTFRQLKFIIPGALSFYFLQTLSVFLNILRGQNGYGRAAALTSLGLGLTTVCMFLYVLTIPWRKGIQPNFSSWRDAGELSSVIPVLTASIVSGWSLLSVTLGHWSELGYLKGVFGASGMYALVFGLMGLLPAPKVRRP